MLDDKWVRLMSSLLLLDVSHMRPKNWESYHKINSCWSIQCFRIFFTDISHHVEVGLVYANKKPVDDLNEWDDAESKTEAKEPSKGGNKVHRTHSDASLKLKQDIG